MTDAWLFMPILPTGFVALGLIAVMLCGLVFYALYAKGDVRVQLSRGKTTFKLEAKERNSRQP